MSRRRFAYVCFCLADHGVWLLVKLLPGPVMLSLIRTRPWLRCQVALAEGKRNFLVPRVRSLLAERCQQAGWGSSCLSRSLLARILLDLIGVPNQLHLGMNRLTNSSRIPHAWLSMAGRELSPGLEGEGGCRILTL
jgi:hypothetical protein